MNQNQEFKEIQKEFNKSLEELKRLIKIDPTEEVQKNLHKLRTIQKTKEEVLQTQEAQKKLEEVLILIKKANGSHGLENNLK